jgi:hypothetical protein
MGSMAESYYKAALERIDNAHILHIQGRYSFAMYASGLAVECLLRAFRVLRDPSFEERHDLKLLWKKTALSDTGRGITHKRIYSLLTEIGLRWRNTYRFAAEDEVQSFLKKSGYDRGIKGNFLKYNSKNLSEAYVGPPPETYPKEKMEVLERKVRTVLNMKFTDEEIRFDHDPGERISGFIVSDKFLDMDHETRQDLLWELFGTHLTPEEQQQVLGFFALTTHENQAYSEDYEYAD